mmetsp:Transcript_13642/g.33570  ORF Transcript_13642/g.33570 Transcript_13642/m.33570 type:complete len:266 (-) Transcript_13642:4250-5047(-)
MSAAPPGLYCRNWFWRAPAPPPLPPPRGFPRPAAAPVPPPGGALYPPGILPQQDDEAELPQLLLLKLSAMLKLPLPPPLPAHPLPIEADMNEPPFVPVGAPATAFDVPFVVLRPGAADELPLSILPTVAVPTLLAAGATSPHGATMGGAALLHLAAAVSAAAAAALLSVNRRIVSPIDAAPSFWATSRKLSRYRVSIFIDTLLRCDGSGGVMLSTPPSTAEYRGPAWGTIVVFRNSMGIRMRSIAWNRSRLCDLSHITASARCKT